MNYFITGQLVHNLIGSQAKLLAYDHNWDVPSYPLDVLKNSPQGTFAGTAWHCYGGDMATAMDQMHNAFPQYDQHVTECTGGYPNGVCDINKGMDSFGWNHEWDMSNILLGAAAHWSSSGVNNVDVGAC
jgi:glucosylceramidase